MKFAKILPLSVLLMLGTHAGAQEVAKALVERASHEAEGVMPGGLRERGKALPEELLTDQEFLRLLEMAPASYREKSEAIDPSVICEIVAKWTIASYGEACRSQMASGKVDPQIFCRELMLHRLAKGLLSEADYAKVPHPLVQAEQRKHLEDDFRQEPVQMLPSYVGTMGSQHDRLLCIAETLKNLPEGDKTSLRGSAVTALFQNGEDWKTPQGREILMEIIRTDNEAGLRVLLERLTAMKKGVPEPLVEEIEQRVGKDYKQLHLYTKDGVIAFLSSRPYRKSQEMYKAVILAEERPEVRAMLIPTVWENDPEALASWLGDVLPKESVQGLSQLQRDPKMPRKEREDVMRPLLALQSPVVHELLGRLCVKEGWMDHPMVGMLLDAGDFSPGLAKSLAADMSWKNTTGVEVLKKLWPAERKNARVAFLESLEKSGQGEVPGYAEECLRVLASGPLDAFACEDLIPTINLAAAGGGRMADARKVFAGLLEENSALLAKRDPVYQDELFAHLLYASREIPGVAEDIKGVIVSCLTTEEKGMTANNRVVAAAYALRSWPHNKPFDEELVKAVETFLKKEGDGRANVKRFAHTFATQDFVSAKWEILNQLAQRKAEVPRFKEVLEELSSRKVSPASEGTDRDLGEKARELLQVEKK